MDDKNDNKFTVTVVTVNSSLTFSKANLLTYHNLKEASRKEEDIEITTGDTAVNIKGKHIVSITKDNNK